MSDVEQLVTESLNASIRAIMDVRAKLCANGVLTVAVDNNLKQAMVELGVLYPNLQESVLFLLGLRSEYEAKMLEANEKQMEKFGPFLAEAAGIDVLQTVEDVENFLKNIGNGQA